MRVISDAKRWLTENGVVEVECLAPDLNGILRGKALPAAKFLAALEDGALFFPSSAFLVNVTGNYSGSIDRDFAYADPDMRLAIDPDTLRLAPGRTGTAWAFADPHRLDGRPWMASPRHLLKHVVNLYAERGWRAVAAPELEFYLAAPNPDPSWPLAAPLGACGRAETAQHPYDLEATLDQAPVLDAIRAAGAQAGLPLEALSHETGAAQFEINFPHGDPLTVADRAVLFKRIAREAAQGFGMHATFMAKPMETEAGSSTHLHISVVDGNGRNIFADGQGADTPLFCRFIGGLQRYLPETMPLLAPYVNSFRRLAGGQSAPANVEWSRDNRSCGLRVPLAAPAARRIENRLPGADANPYLALSASLLCGLLGIREKCERREEAFGNAYAMPGTLPRSMHEALARYTACEPVRALLGEEFFQNHLRVKQRELEAFEQVVTAWERQYLLLKA